MSITFSKLFDGQVQREFLITDTGGAKIQKRATRKGTEKNDFALKMIFFFPEKKFMQVQTTEDILNSYFGEKQLSYHF